MTKQAALKVIKRLTKEINEHNERYYNLDQPTITDQEYDELIRTLIELEEQFPSLKSLDSPTQRVGVKLKETAQAVIHKRKMYSLDNTYSFAELRAWHNRVVKGLALLDHSVEYVVELKIDGVSASLTYENGSFTLGTTRGDGLTGEDITNNLRTLPSVPLQLKKVSGWEIPSILEVRGEIYMDRKDFDKLNEDRQQNGEVLFANPRNATSGSVKLLDSRLTARRRLKCFIHSFGMLEGKREIKSHWEFLNLASRFGFQINPHHRRCKSFKEVTEFCEEFADKRDLLPYEVDGVVIKVNFYSDQLQLGVTSKSPRWAVAYKFQAKQATTVVRDIVVQVGRTGVLTPVAELEPVECAGVTISRSTLHNFDEVSRLKIQKGDRVLLERAGDVIPKIIKVVQSNSDRSQSPFVIPEHCPACGGQVAKTKEEDVAYRCINPSCPKQLERRLMHFSSRSAMDIEGLGQSAILQLLDKQLVHDLADIYFLKKDDLLPLELFAEKKAENLLSAIEMSKARPLHRFIYGLGILNIGEKSAYIIAQKFLTMDRLMKASSVDFKTIYEIGDVMASSLEGFLKQKSTRHLIEKFKKAGLSMVEKQHKTQEKLQGKKIVFTGELPGFTRQEVYDLVKKLDGDVTESVSKKTDFVVVGKNPGSKYDKALSLGVKILDEQKFKEMIND